MNKSYRCLFLWLDSKEFYCIEAAKRDIRVDQVFKSMPITLRAIRRLQIEFKLPFISPWIGSWKNFLSKYDSVIIHASSIIPPVVEFIRNVNPNIRIILWYWNPVDKCVSLDSFTGINCEFWSFDEKDCKKYDLKYNTQYYFRDIYLPDNKIENDVFFVGGDKGRLENLIQIKKILDDEQIANYLHITASGNRELKYKKFYKNKISYQDVLNYISKSRAIMDYVSENQAGLTIRPLESLFLQKKLITNDYSIVNRDFYNCNNIFILNKDNISDLKDFLDSPFVPIESEIVNKYDFDNWFERFFI